MVYDIICPDCKRERICGLSFDSEQPLSEQCCTKFKEIAEGLHYCETCKLIIPLPNYAFERYFQNAEEIWTAFRQEHEEYLYQLRQHYYRAEELTEKEAGILEIVDTFFHARENIRFDNLLLISSDSRKRAYQFVTSFEALKSIEI